MDKQLAPSQFSPNQGRTLSCARKMWAKCTRTTPTAILTLCKWWFPLILVEKATCFKWLQHVSFKQPCPSCPLGSDVRAGGRSFGAVFRSSSSAAGGGRGGGCRSTGDIPRHAREVPQSPRAECFRKLHGVEVKGLSAVLKF